jgi:hypothetical protein
MPELSLTEAQYEQLEQVRGDIEEAYIDNYGYVPIEDAFEYLLDTYTPPDERDTADTYERIAAAEYPQLQRVASNVPDVPGSGIDADEMRGRLLAELGPEVLADRLDAVASGDETATDSTPPTESSTDRETEGVTSTTEDTGSKTDDRPDSAGTGDEVAPETGTDDGDNGPGRATAENGSGVSGDGDPLAAVNQMLREHDDKWRESGGDEPYEVDLPDGTSETARTKDDVRQLLFRHY